MISASRGNFNARRSNQPRKANVGDNVKEKGKPGGRKKSKADHLDLGSLFSSDIIREAHANSAIPPIPRFTQKNKEEAFKELIASIPAADQDEARSDKNAVIEATRKFTNKARSDGKGGWKIKGLKTSLYHHQVRLLLSIGTYRSQLTFQKLLGAAFMVFLYI